MTVRNYSYKDVVMLMAAKTILQSMLDNLTELSPIRSTWNAAYVSALIQKIDDATEKYLGLDKKQPLREATTLLASIQGPALRDLSFIKTQIEVDFSSEKTFVLAKLGLNRNLHNISQESLIELLYSFKKGMDDTLKEQMTAKGTNPTLIDTATGYARQLEQANLSQESLKSSTREVSQQALDAFNAIYDEVIGISKIASKFYSENPLKKDQFTFKKVVKNMGGAVKKEEIPPVTE